jgi:hypothetical protein
LHETLSTIQIRNASIKNKYLKLVNIEYSYEPQLSHRRDCGEKT